MANALYPLTKAKMMQAQLDMSSATIKAALLDTGTVAYNAAHDFYNDISAGVVGTPQTIGSKTFISGTFDGADITFTGVSGASAEAIVIYEDTGNVATSKLIAFLDSGYTNLPVTPNSGDIAVTWDAAGIFTL